MLVGLGAQSASRLYNGKITQLGIRMRDAEPNIRNASVVVVANGA